jgi:hypothetical protein
MFVPQKKILFITTTQIYKAELIGIKTKIETQFEAMKEIGFEVDIISIKEPNKVFLNDNVLYRFKNKYWTSLLFFNMLSRKIKENYEFIYIRNPLVFDQVGFLHFLRMHKKSNIILELPTFPYRKERSSFFQRVTSFVEFLFSPLYKKYIDLILYSGNKVDKIYGINALQIKHGGNFEESLISDYNIKENQINFVAVAGFSKWHGYDRLLSGIKSVKDYADINGSKIHLFLVGDKEPLYSEFKEYIRTNKLDKLITICGGLHGKDLEDIYQKSHVGIGSLGMHRIGLYEGSPLKSAEYAVRGLPFIVGFKDSTFFDKDYCFQIPGDESPVMFTDIVSWYKELEINKPEMRKFTLENFSWQKQLTMIFKI